MEKILNQSDLYTGDNRKRSTASVGYVGLHNAMVALFGKKEWHKDEEIYQFSIQTLQFLQDYIDRVQDDFEVYISLYSTPSESLADRFAKLDRERFGVIENVNDMEYYENSFHYPSFLDTDPFSKIEFEEPYYKIATAGFMHYVEMPNLNNNHKAFESFGMKLMINYVILVLILLQICAMNVISKVNLNVINMVIHARNVVMMMEIK